MKEDDFWGKAGELDGDSDSEKMKGIPSEDMD